MANILLACMNHLIHNMKRTFSFVFLLTLSILSHAQVGSESSSKYQYVKVRVKAMVMDAKTSLPIPYATVYLVPQGDTTITNFALSGENGQVVLEKVISGRYQLSAELLGYETFTKAYDIYQAPGWDLDLGTISMEEDAELIDAASITVAGNPITIQNDTVIYNASSFRTGENAMLEDLLKKMPGIQVSEDGTATVNGEKVDRITVGGKTFFFGDPSMALKNLPAKIVERIKVSRQESKSAEMGGISTEITKETVMDVELKEEYKEGWFGDVRLGVGSTINGKSDNPLTQDTRFLYDGSAMATVYGKKDQAVFIGNAYNIQTSGEGTGSSGLSVFPDDKYSDLGGLITAIKAGANYNTQRIKDFETTVSANYRHVTKDDKRRSSRTSYIPGSSDLNTESGADAKGVEDQLVLDAEFYKQKGKVLVNFAPRFYFRKSNVNSINFSANNYAFSSTLAKTYSASSLSNNKQFLTSGTLSITETALGKPGRRLGFSLDYDAGVSNGNKFEKSLQTLDYDNQGKKLNLDGQLFYYEPLGACWGLEAKLSSVYNSTFSDRSAFDEAGHADDYYTSRTDRHFMQEGGSVLMRFSNDTSTVKFGLSASLYNDNMDARLLGVNSIIGKGDWRFLFTPVVTYSFAKDGHQLQVQYGATSKPASSRQMIPVPDISNPVQITSGNTYLKSGVGHSLMTYYNMVNYSTYTFLTVYAFANVDRNGTVYASWFDNAGIRYAVPVNAQKPGTNARLYAMLNQPFGKMKNFTFSLAAQTSFDNRYSYQATSLQPGLNLANFDYKSFMDVFWGNKAGDRFYSGQSGFAESRTQSFNWGVGLNLKYNKDFFTGTLSANASNGRASYSMNPAADMNVWDFNIGGDLLFQLNKGWEIGTDARYVFFRGYSSGYGQPEFRWNMTLNKTIKSVTLGLKCNDILNQCRSLTRVVSAEYVEDSYRNVMGRTFLFSVSFNFGKLNSNKTSAVSSSKKKMDY